MSNYHWKLLDAPAAERASFGQASNLLFILVSISMIFLILNNVRSWRQYRETLSEQYPDIPYKTGILTWASEILMCLLIAITCFGFLMINPL